MNIENHIVSIRAGVAIADITPSCPVSLCGYPGTSRIANHVHDPLQVSALHLRNGSWPVLLISADLYALDAPFISDLRQTIHRQTHIPEENILISCTHTHSAPATVTHPAWPDIKVAPDYLETVRTQILHVAARASATTRPVDIAWTTASLENQPGVRPVLPKSMDPEIGILVCRKPEDGGLYAAMIIAGLKPAVLDETSRSVSADFPHFLRTELKKKFGEDLAVLYHTAPCGEHQPEDFGGEHTFQNAEHIGRLLADTISASIGRLTLADFAGHHELSAVTSRVILPPRELPSAWDSRVYWGDCQAEHNRLVESKADPHLVHAADRAVHEAKSVLDLLRAQGRGELQAFFDKDQTAEVQLLQIGDIFIAGLPAELDSSYTHDIRSRVNRKVFVVQLANGELQGNIPVPGHKCISSLFGPAAGQQLVQAVLTTAGEKSTPAPAASCLSAAA